MIGFSVPQADEVLVMSYEGTHLLTLGDEISVVTDEDFIEYDIYDPETGVAEYRGKKYQIIGLQGGSPLLDGKDRERLVLDEDAETLAVTQRDKVVFSTRYSNFSGDWAAATFSPDSRYIVLGCPYDFDFMAFKRSG
jgi:hypothetical protein